MPLTDNTSENTLNRAHWAVLVGILIFSSLYRFGVFLIEPYPQQPPFTSDSSEYFGLAQDLAAGTDYTVSDGERVVSRAMLPPLYPLFLAAFIATVGFQSTLIFSVQIALSVFVIWATFWLARRVLPPWPSLFATTLVALSPAMALQPNRLLTEALYIPLLALTAVLLFTSCERNSLKWAALTGLSCGATLLTRNVAILLPFALVGTFIILFPIRRAIGLGLCLMLGTAFALSPWWANNYFRYGSIRPQQVTQGTGAFTSYAVLAHHGFVAVPARVPFPYDDPQAAQRLYMEKVREPSLKPGYVPPVTSRYFLSHPMAYVHQSWWRFFLFAKPTSQGAVAFGCADGFGEYLQARRFDILFLKAITLGLDMTLVLGGLAGTLLAFRRFHAFVPFFAIGGHFLAIHTLVHATVRYRHPLIPILAVLSAFAFSELWIRFKGSSWSQLNT